MAWLALTGIGVAVLISWRQQINPGVAGAVVALILGRVAPNYRQDNTELLAGVPELYVNFGNFLIRICY